MLILQVFMILHLFPQELMLEEEAECIATNVNNNMTNPSNVTDHPLSNGPADKGVAVLNASAKWSPDLVKDSLSNINFRVPEGKLCAVIGPVGSGKVRIKLLSPTAMTVKISIVRFM
jgi:ABC-type multidrug transport system fused ATPase/permease subunit